ncbi:hypothetical protein LTR84_007177 [Exophiala bonariae]|uniref:G-protein coupled receptors family 1 profile domain-containing protein n=1 Tax=Exophiala bonariae TaxID=1690606 RepID=A0AAV9N209_9EURO|nr:hypothetical protein LTR84_007177 [Exophiala bonariae]
MFRVLTIAYRTTALRTQRLSLRSITRLPAIRIYLIAVYFWGMCFIIAVATLRFGYQIGSDNACFASIILCLVFYVVDKIILYLFLIERIHIVRSRRYTRLTDNWYVVNIAILVLGFGSIAVLSFIFPVAELSDGQCRIGLPFKITLPLLIYDITINLYLTGHFLHFSRPGLASATFRRLPFVPTTPVSSDVTYSHVTRLEDGGQDNLRNLAKRTLRGMCIMLLATTINLSILFYMSGREQEWMCFMFCTLDGMNIYPSPFPNETMLMMRKVTIGILALHYVTNHPSEKQLGMKNSCSALRHYDPWSPQNAGRQEFPSSAGMRGPVRTMVSTGSQHDREEIITAPDRIFISTTYEVFFFALGIQLS